MSFSLMLIGQLMLEPGCGSPAHHFLPSFFQFMTQSNLVEKLTPMVIISGNNIL
jgi:hypothetical protein